MPPDGTATLGRHVTGCAASAQAGTSSTHKDVTAYAASGLRRGGSDTLSRQMHTNSYAHVGEWAGPTRHPSRLLRNVHITSKATLANRRASSRAPGAVEPQDGASIENRYEPHHRRD